MAVMLIVLGTVIKLTLAVAVTYRTRWWWLPGTASTGLGALALAHGGRTETLGHAGVMLGLVAVLLARAARAGVPVR
jgi:hypothetical protein